MARLLRALTDNWKLKLLALVPAVLLWVVVSAEQVTSEWIPATLQVDVNADGYRLAPASARQDVQVRFTGPGRELWDLVIRRPEVVLRVSEVDDTVDVFPLDARMVQIPRELQAVAQDVRPGAVELRFSRVEARTLPVQLRAEELPSGYTLVDSLRITPSQIRVSGPAERLAGLSTLPTDVLSLSADDSSFVRFLALDTTGLQGLQLSATRVRVAGEVDAIGERTLVGVPISVGSGVTVRPDSVNVRLRGAARVIGRLDRGDVRPVISIDSIPGRIPPEGITVPIRVERVPAGVQASPDPPTARLVPARMILDTVPVPGAAASDTAGAVPGS